MRNYKKLCEGLRNCSQTKDCRECALYNHGDCYPDFRLRIAADAIETLQAENARLKAELDVMTKNLYLTEANANWLKTERDAAVRDIKHDDNCDVCIQLESPCDCEEFDFDCATCKKECRCRDCRNENKWQWRGVQED